MLSGYRNDGWGLFSMLVGSGFKKYVIVGNRGPPFLAVAESDDEGDFLECLAKLQQLTADDIMQSCSSEFPEALEVLVTKAKKIHGPAAGHGAGSRPRGVAYGCAEHDGCSCRREPRARCHRGCRKSFRKL